jgi:hypothetical protein
MELEAWQQDARVRLDLKIVLQGPGGPSAQSQGRTESYIQVTGGSSADRPGFSASGPTF